MDSDVFDDQLSSEVPPVEVATADEATQLGTFANATLGYTKDGKWAVSIATYIDLPAGLDFDTARLMVRSALVMAAAASPILMFDARVGQSFDYESVVAEEQRAAEREENDIDDSYYEEEE